jgi:L-rhamnose mutarotase
MSTTTIQAFRMHLKPGNEAEFARRHARLRPEMKELIKQAGVSDFNPDNSPVSVPLELVFHLD